MYFFDGGSQVDCSAENLIIRDVKGINTFKCYFQTPAYVIGTEPEKGGVGSGNNIFFENINHDSHSTARSTVGRCIPEPLPGENPGNFPYGSGINRPTVPLAVE